MFDVSKVFGIYSFKTALLEWGKIISMKLRSPDG